MNDLSPEDRLSQHRTVAAWLEWQLGQERRIIRDLEAQVERERRARERAHAEQRWKLQPSRSSSDRTAILHRGGCGQWRHEMGYLERDEVQLALEDEEIKIEYCEICQPETGLNG